MSLVEYLWEVCKILGILALSLFFWSVIIGIIKSMINNFRARKIKKQIQKELAPKIEEIINQAAKELKKKDTPKKTTKPRKRTTKKDSE